MKFKRKAKIEKGKLDITPLVDVVLQLLIFFMLSSSFVMQSGIKIDLPNAGQKEQKEEKKSITISITKEALLFLNETKMLLPEIKNEFTKNIKENPKLQLIIRADAKVTHGKVVEIMDVAKQCGIHKISIATQTDTI